MDQKIFLISYRRVYDISDYAYYQTSFLKQYGEIETIEVAADNMAEAIKAVPDNSYLNADNYSNEIISISDITEIFYKDN